MVMRLAWRLKKMFHRLSPRHRGHYCYRCVALDAHILWGDVKPAMRDEQ